MMPTARGFLLPSSSQVGTESPASSPPASSPPASTTEGSPHIGPLDWDEGRSTRRPRRVNACEDLRINTSFSITPADAIKTMMPTAPRLRPRPSCIVTPRLLHAPVQEGQADIRSASVVATGCLPVEGVDRLSMAFAKIAALRFEQQLSGCDSTFPNPNSSTGSAPCTPHPALPPLFASLCVTDPKSMGNPIKLRSSHFRLNSRGLRVGGCDFLNWPRRANDGCVLSIEPGKDGRPRFWLEFALPMLEQYEGGQVYVLTAQIDVTEIIRQLAISEVRGEASAGGSGGTHLVASSSGSRSPAVGLETANTGVDAQSTVDYWIENTERDITTDTEDESSTSSARTSSRSLAVFFSLVQNVQSYYTSYIVLTPASSAGPFASSSAKMIASDPLIQLYDVTYVSPALYANAVDLHYNFSLTPPEVLGELGWALSTGKRLRTRVRWGGRGETKWVYCVPVVDGGKRPKMWWVLFLVAEKVGKLWW